MKKMAKKVTAIILTSLLAVPLTVGISAAVDKLIVQDGSANTVYKVEDTGVATGTFGANVLSGASPDFDYTYMNQESYSDTNWKGGFFVAKRARGTSLAPTGVLLNDTVFTFDAQAWDGSAWARGGQIMGKVDGTPSAGKIPFFWTFRTMGNDGVLGDRFQIKADGQVTVNDLAGSYGGGSAYVCVDNAGQLFASETACP